MPTNYTGRFTLIAIVLVLALWCVFPGAHKGDFHPDLKPGIDMVGGTSLLYEIKASPSSGPPRADLAEQVMASLKKRVDPDGVRNLIWRPQGATRLEIQMPGNRKTGDSKARRDAFATAQAKLEATNVRSNEVLNAIEKLKGDERRDRLSKLAQGSPTREKLFGALASLHDQIKIAGEKKDVATEAEKELEYDKLKLQIEDTNISPTQLESTLASADGAKRLEELKAKYVDFPDRTKALEEFATAHTQYVQVKGTLDDAADLKRLLRGSGVLEFHIVADYSAHAPRAMQPPDVQEMIRRLEARGPVVQAGDTMRWYATDQASEGGDKGVPYNGKTYVLCYITPDKSMANREGQVPWALERAMAQSDSSTGERMVSFSFDPQGAKYFGDLSGSNIGKQLAIILDDRLISAPVLHSRISASGQITGNKAEGGFSVKEVNYLVSMLSAGSLPARLTDEPISERTVGSNIGADNLRAGLIACAFGLFVVAVFLIGYYYLAGVVAMIAVTLNMIIILGVMAMFNATFTLPGVAGIVLTIGMAVDANVLIFERLREEQQRGLSLRMALRNAYDRAFSAILDGNVTTGITSLCLYWFGSEEVKGFGLTLIIGLVASLFTALFVTKTIFGVLIDHFGVDKLGSLPLTFPKWDQALRPNIDWMAKAKYFYAFSVVVIVLGLVAFGIKLKQGKMLDIEFASGTSVQMDLKQPMKIEEVREIVNNMARSRPEALPAPSVVPVSGSGGMDDKTYEIVTPNKDAKAVKEAVLAAFSDKLNLTVPSEFANAGKPFTDAINAAVFPIESDTQRVGSFVPRGLASHLQGVAILLDNLTPALKPSEIKSRIEQQRLQPTAGDPLPYRDISVVSENGTDEPTKTAVVMVSDSAFPHDVDAPRWTQELASPMWRLANEAINSPADLQKVVNFDAQVAGETQREAMIALVLTIVGIMAYIWLRFGNLRYGTATVVALLHDTLFCLAAVGIAHYVADTGIGRALLIEPFRINLTLVAAVLTVMGYSMNDTVVVFDRVRENRGKFGAVSRRIVNDSINQTLSRTLLTGGTTILTIFVMYIFGGPGIHGFTYALLIGIVVGTYSSIAIASPILLTGVKSDQSGGKADKNRDAETRKPPVGQLQRVGG